MVQVHVPLGVGVRVPPWAPLPDSYPRFSFDVLRCNGTEVERVGPTASRKTPRSLLEDRGVLRCCASAVARAL